MTPTMTRHARTRAHAHAIRASFVAIAFLLAAAGCGSNDGVVDAGDSIDRGWEAFSQGDYAQAEAYFLAALDVDSTAAEAHTGLGWTRGFDGRFDEAVVSFERAVILDTNDPDAAGGLAAAALVSGNTEGAASSAELALAIDPAWVFPPRSGVDWEDLRLIIAQARSLDREYADAQDQVDLLDPENGLDPENSATWVVADVAYETYPEALLAELEEIEKRVGATLP
jgi:tetratricopeptide (TPR) repeat protein